MSEVSSTQVRSALRFLLIIQLVFTALGAWLFTLGPDPLRNHAGAVSFAFGGVVMWLNLLAHVFVWPRLLQKKSVALSVSVIVFKFALLGWILYETATGHWISERLGLSDELGRDSFNLMAFAGGLALVLPSVFATALKLAFSKSVDETNNPTHPTTA